MKKLLVVTSLAMTLIAPSAFARSAKTLEAVEKGAEKLKLTTPKVETKAGKGDVKLETREVRGKQQEVIAADTVANIDPVSQAANEVERAMDELRRLGASCDPSNLAYVTMEQQKILDEAAEIGIIVSPTCFGGGQMTDIDAIDNGIKTIDAATKEGRIQKLSRYLKARVASVKQKVAIVKAGVVALARELGVSEAEAAPVMKKVCTKCLGMEPSLCELVPAN